LQPRFENDRKDDVRLLSLSLSLLHHRAQKLSFRSRSHHEEEGIIREMQSLMYVPYNEHVLHDVASKYILMLEELPAFAVVALAGRNERSKPWLRCCREATCKGKNSYFSV